MKSWKGMLSYGIVVLLSLVVIFFVGRGPVDTATGKSSFIFTPDGLDHFRMGMDVAGGVRLTYKIDLSKYQEAYTNPQELFSVTKGVKDIILNNIDSRVSSLGVSDYTSYIQSLDDGEYVVVEIGGVSDLDEAKGIIGKTVELEFKTEFAGDPMEVRPTRQLLAEELLKQAVVSPEQIQAIALPKQGENVLYQAYTKVSAEDLPLIYREKPELLAGRTPGSVYPTLVEGAYLNLPAEYSASGVEETFSGWVISKFVSTEVEQTTNSSGEQIETTLYTIEDIFVDYIPTWVTAKDPKTNEILNGAFFRFANVGQGQTGLPVVVINFDEKGKEIFCNLTEQTIGKPMAIFVGGQLMTSPIIQEKICGGSAQIDGQFDGASAKQLVDNLNEGALPAPLILAHEEKVSPTLGEQALEGALWSAGIGLIIVYIFMLVMYGPKRGSIALVTLVAFLSVLFAVTKLFGSALSLSGIAAILLSIGMGVDANVLIYERVKEELALGKSWLQAVEDGYKRSWAAIRDGNLTTAMIAALLFFMGTNMFKGFGTTMIVNIALTFAIIVPLTKILLAAWYDEKTIS